MLQLVETGKLQLDAPVRRFVPELRLKGDAADRITVRQVLQHTSGLPPNAAGGPTLKSADNGTALQAVAELRGKEPAAAPGTEMEYVNANYVLAGLVVERASGEPYGRYLRRHVFAPLGMTRSYTSWRPAHRAGLAAGHRYVFGFTDQTGPLFRPGMLATGYVMSSATDMSRYLAMYLRDGVGLNGHRILSPKGVRALTTPGRHETELGPWSEHATSRYAMGWFVGGPWEEPAALHPGAAADSSSLIALFPRRKLAVATLVNASSVQPIPGNPVAITRMERNVVDALLGEPVDSGTPVRRFYLIVDLVLAVLLALGLVGLGRAVRDARQGRSHRRPVWAVLGVFTRFALAAFVFSYPLLTGLGWKAMRVWHPDLALALVVLCAVLLATAVLRGVLLARHRRSARSGLTVTA